MSEKKLKRIETVLPDQINLMLICQQVLIISLEQRQDARLDHDDLNAVINILHQEFCGLFRFPPGNADFSLRNMTSQMEELYDAAIIDGANDLQKHRHVSVPGLRPQIVFVFVISSLAALKVFEEILVLTNRTGGILDSGVTMVFYLWRQAFRLSHAGYASAVAIVLLLLTLMFSIFNVRLLERGVEGN